MLQMLLSLKVAVKRCVFSLLRKNRQVVYSIHVFGTAMLKAELPYTVQYANEFT